MLDRRFPRNSLLSHDLIEGSYARVGLTTDVEVIDDYPSHYSAYTRRKHRWLRGDWQIAQWLFSKVPDESGKYVRNPISTISRWKIFDNLRRSLVETFTFALLLAGWLALPGGALYWTLVTLFLMFVPTLVQFVFSIGRAYFTKLKGSMRDAVTGFGQGCFISLLNLVYLPHQTLMALDAISRSLVRSFITGQRLLEWETAAESEAASRRTPVDRYLAITPLVALVVAALVFLHHRQSLVVAAPILLLWACAGLITSWLNNAPRQEKPKLSLEEDTFLRQLALKTWRFFHQYGGESHNFLIPDNVEEDGLFEAARVSPTNFGLLLNARQAANTFGYLTVPEFITLTERSLQTFEKLEKYRGHIYNWYDTRTLAPIRPMTISSVDSGNLAASFYTLRSGCRSLLRLPLLSPALFTGIRDHWQLAVSLPDTSADVKALAPPASNMGVDAWIAWAQTTVDSPAFDVPAGPGESAYWVGELHQRVRALVVLVRDYMPWLSPQFASLFALPQLQGLKDVAADVLISSATGWAIDLDARLARASASLAPDLPETILIEELRAALVSAREGLKTLNRELQDLATEAMRFATEMDFGFLMDKSRLLLSIGYEMETQHLHQACYDLLSSEARIAAFITVAKGEAPQQSWFKLGRTHTMAYGHAVLISWTGTMFEYLMPSIWMRSYPDTLVSRTLASVVEIQRAFGREHNIPWGISESGWAGTDDHGHYHYQAFGIPQIALKWDAVAGPVISPYSTCLALGIDPLEAMRNLKRMAKMGWMGALGFYEAADYQESLKTPKLVREWMAHHQGMALLAILNLLQDNIVQDWFHANAHLEATQLLLHEKPIHLAALKAEYQAAQSRKKAS